MGCGLWMVGEEVRLLVKAELAGVLIQRAFASHLDDGAPHRPWRWADTYPIAVLSVDRLDLSRHVLTGASGESLAFALGHVDGTTQPNGDGNCVLAGHRDTEGAFLQDLEVGDVLRLRTHDTQRVYVVSRVDIVSETAIRVLDPTPERKLTLATCYPFDGVRASPLRFIVTCAPAPHLERTTPPSGSPRRPRRV